MTAVSVEEAVGSGTGVLDESCAPVIAVGVAGGAVREAVAMMFGRISGGRAV